MTPITNNVHHQEDSLSYLLLQEIDSAAGCYLKFGANIYNVNQMNSILCVCLQLNIVLKTT
jgi:hypothetical protein